MGRRIVVTEFVTLDGVMEDPGGFAAAWPSMTDEQAFAAKMNAMPKYVVSSTLADPSWTNSHVIAVDEVEGLEGTLLVAGSQQLVQTLVERGLVDELRLVLHPTAIGAGKKLFEVPGDFALASAEPSEQVVLLTFGRSAT